MMPGDDCTIVGNPGIITQVWMLGTFIVAVMDDGAICGRPSRDVKLVAQNDVEEAA